MQLKFLQSKRYELLCVSEVNNKVYISLPNLHKSDFISRSPLCLISGAKKLLKVEDIEYS